MNTKRNCLDQMFDLLQAVSDYNLNDKVVREYRIAVRVNLSFCRFNEVKTRLLNANFLRYVNHNLLITQEGLEELSRYKGLKRTLGIEKNNITLDFMDDGMLVTCNVSS